MPENPIYLAMELMGLTLRAPTQPCGLERDAMQDFWKKAGLESVETREIRIYDRLCRLQRLLELECRADRAAGQNNRWHVSERARSNSARVCATIYLSASDGRIAYEAFANAVKGRVRG